jgi:hypothetical protein
MGRLAVQPSSTTKRSACRFFWAGLVCLHLCGCANFWDDVFDRDFTPKQLFTRPDPVAVLQDPDADGNKRYKALAQLREPLANGGTQEEQEQIFQILETAATKDQAPVCRLAALSALGRFKDARAATVIDSVFDQQLPFAKEMNTLVREQCLMALIDTGSPVALNRLALVAKEPPANGPTEERLETLDRQLIAVRGLAKFKQPEAAAALAYVLCAKKNDVALRDRAHESLVACTGKDLPVDSPQWQSYLPPSQAVNQAGGTGAAANTPVNQVSASKLAGPEPGPQPPPSQPATSTMQPVNVGPVSVQAPVPGPPPAVVPPPPPLPR